MKMEDSASNFIRTSCAIILNFVCFAIKDVSFVLTEPDQWFGKGQAETLSLDSARLRYGIFFSMVGIFSDSQRRQRCAIHRGNDPCNFQVT